MAIKYTVEICEWEVGDKVKAEEDILDDDDNIFIHRGQILTIEDIDRYHEEYHEGRIEVFFVEVDGRFDDWQFSLYEGD